MKSESLNGEFASDAQLLSARLPLRSRLPLARAKISEAIESEKRNRFKHSVI